METKADILILCEVDHLDDTYGPLLKRKGFEFFSVSRRGMDMILIAFNPNIFKYENHKEIQHDVLSEDFPPASNKHANDFTRGNCAIYVNLTHISSNKPL